MVSIYTWISAVVELSNNKPYMDIIYRRNDISRDCRERTCFKFRRISYVCINIIWGHEYYLNSFFLLYVLLALYSS